MSFSRLLEDLSEGDLEAPMHGASRGSDVAMLVCPRSTVLISAPRGLTLLGVDNRRMRRYSSSFGAWRFFGSDMRRRRVS